LPPKDPVSILIARVKLGDQAAATDLWNSCFSRLRQIARARLGNTHRRVSDEEDAVIMALHSFMRGLKAERFPQLHTTQDLWSILVALTLRKAVDILKKERRRKRGGGKVRGESAFSSRNSAKKLLGIDDVASTRRSPLTEAMLNEECQRRLATLSTSLRVVALAKLHGLSNEEIATELSCGLRTVERKLYIIRMLWSREVK